MSGLPGALPSRQLVVNTLLDVMDPELNMDVWTLGLIYGIDIKDGIVRIRMTFTTPLCPYGPALIDDIKTRIKSLEDVKDVVVDVVFEPPWTPPEDLRLMYGV